MVACSKYNSDFNYFRYCIRGYDRALAKTSQAKRNCVREIVFDGTPVVERNSSHLKVTVKIIPKCRFGD